MELESGTRMAVKPGCFAIQDETKKSDHPPASILPSFVRRLAYVRCHVVPIAFFSLQNIIITDKVAQWSITHLILCPLVAQWSMVNGRGRPDDTRLTTGGSMVFRPTIVLHTQNEDLPPACQPPSGACEE